MMMREGGTLTLCVDGGDALMMMKLWKKQQQRL